MDRRNLLALALAIPLVVTGMASTAAAQFTDAEAFPGPEEVDERLDEFDQHPWITVEQIGTSTEDRPIHVAEVVDPNASTPREERAVTLILTQQHGNEPAGTPAALRLLENVTSGGPVTDQLDEQILLVLPMVNPDGAAENTRGNADGVDINRDHIALDTPEARAVHEVINEWDVDVALDHHEYGGIGAGNPVPARVYDYDVTTLFPKHGNVRETTRDAAKDLMYEGIWPELRQEGYSVNEYGEVTAAGQPAREIAGGPDPGILRNHYGLHNVAGLLVESRVDFHPNPFHTPERRIQSHTVVMEATTQYVDRHADRFVQARENSQELAVELPADEYVEGDTRAELAEAYQFEDTSEVRETFQLHGIEPGTSQGDEIVHDAIHPLRGHAAAIYHPASSRNVTEGVATQAPANASSAGEQLDQASTEANGVPLGLGATAAALAGAVALAARTRAAR